MDSATFAAPMEQKKEFNIPAPPNLKASIEQLEPVNTASTRMAVEDIILDPGATLKENCYDVYASGTGGQVSAQPR
jgi:hypothetical protein